jgi:hypothetical protein
MVIKIEGMDDRISHLYKICEDFTGDSFIILSDVFICFFDISDEDLSKFNTSLRKARMEIMQKLLIDGKLLDEDSIYGNASELVDILLISHEHYHLPIYIKAYWLLQYVSTGNGNFLQLAILSPYYLPPDEERIEEVIPGYQ